MLLSEERKNNVSLHFKKKDMEINGNNFSSPTEAGMYLYRQYANISGLVDKSPEEMSPDEVRSLQSYCRASYTYVQSLRNADNVDASEGYIPSTVGSSKYDYKLPEWDQLPDFYKNRIINNPYIKIYLDIIATGPGVFESYKKYRKRVQAAYATMMDSINNIIGSYNTWKNSLPSVQKDQFEAAGIPASSMSFAGSVSPNPSETAPEVQDQMYYEPDDAAYILDSIKAGIQTVMACWSGGLSSVATVASVNTAKAVAAGQGLDNSMKSISLATKADEYIRKIYPSLSREDIQDIRDNKFPLPMPTGDDEADRYILDALYRYTGSYEQKTQSNKVKIDYQDSQLAGETSDAVVNSVESYRGKSGENTFFKELGDLIRNTTLMEAKLSYNRMRADSKDAEQDFAFLTAFDDDGGFGTVSANEVKSAAEKSTQENENLVKLREQLFHLTDNIYDAAANGETWAELTMIALGIGTFVPQGTGLAVANMMNANNQADLNRENAFSIAQLNASNRKR